ncbi:DUF4097 family beta strand repeat-containing protein [Pseudoalteromonas fenneropenaei]|uniref:DUF4097 family beta strand repeat-containing protein n=1 Tax=Pseudoalteromonas fenneropenaei TaxID=1737459 RepID=A0ABV7CNA8_9GAMM
MKIAKNLMMIATLTCFFGTFSAIAKDYSLVLSNPSKAANIKVAVLNGAVNVIGYQGEAVMVSADVKPLDKVQPSVAVSTDKPTELKKVKAATPAIILEERDNEVDIISLSREQTVNLTIKVPNNSNLTVQVSKGGDIQVSDVSGELELQNGQGAIIAANISGPIVAESGQQDIKVTFVNFEQRQPSSLTSHNGNIDVSLPANVKSDIRVQTYTGEVYSGLDTEFQALEEVRNDDDGRQRVVIGGTMATKVNGGGQQLSLSTYAGNVFVRQKP